MSVCPPMPKLDSKKIREDFPILSRLLDSKPLVYLDSAATAQKPRQVIAALTDYYSSYNANIHRGVHTLAEEATEAFESTREKIARFISARHSREIVFTKNTTEAVNLVAQSWARQNLKAGDQILLSPMEHHSNLVPWQMLAKERGLELVFARLTDDGLLDLDSIAELLSERLKLVAITQMSNVLGSIVPLKELCRLVHSAGARVFVDGAQGVPHLATDVRDIDCDFLAFSMHKICGPTGVGVLYGKEELLESMPPYMGGGDMISIVRRESFTPNQIPWKFEAGTPNIADVIASAAAIDYVSSIGMENIRQHEIALTAYALEKLSAVDGISIYGPMDPQKKGGVISFNIEGLHPHDLGQIVNEDAVAIRVGHHCCQPLMRDLDVMGTARASFYIYTVEQEIDQLVAALERAKKVFSHVAVR